MSNFSAVSPIPLKDCTFRISAKQWGEGVKNKMKEMYHFRYEPDFPLNTCAVRRLPCCCKGPGGCEEQLLRPWELGIPPQEQKRYQRAPNCKLTPMMKDMNDWLFVSTDLLQANSDTAKAQINNVLQESLDLHVSSMKAAVISGKFGTVSNSKKERFWLVKWTGPPHQLTAPRYLTLLDNAGGTGAVRLIL